MLTVAISIASEAGYSCCMPLVGMLEVIGRGAGGYGIGWCWGEAAAGFDAFDGQHLRGRPPTSDLLAA